MHTTDRTGGLAPQLLRAAIALFALVALPLPCQANNPGDALVVVAAKFIDGVEWGTGAFVDHDGLILTADHVVHRALAKPLSTMTEGKVPTPTTPVSITVYSSRLAKPLMVDLTVSGNVLGGAYSADQWMDAAFVRVNLTDVQRALALTQLHKHQNRLLILCAAARLPTIRRHCSRELCAASCQHWHR